MSLLRSIDDLSDQSVGWILERAASRRAAAGEGRVAERLLDRPPLVGLLFLDTSLRTRVGFTAAAARLGGSVAEVLETRYSEVSMPESPAHTLRVLTGYCDVVVARLDRPLDASVVTSSLVPVVNGGDRGRAAEHPTQALIDLFAIEQDLGRPEELTVAVIGDLRMRSVRSLLRLLARRPPLRLVLVTDAALSPFEPLPAPLVGRAEQRTAQQLDDVDVLYVAGIPHAAVGEEVRTALRVTPEVMVGLPRHAVVMSPLPVIDEIDQAAQANPRFRAFLHSDDGLHIRAAVLERLLLTSLALR